jgi:hypothetical protein
MIPSTATDNASSLSDNPTLIGQIDDTTLNSSPAVASIPMLHHHQQQQQQQAEQHDSTVTLKQSLVPSSLLSPQANDGTTSSIINDPAATSTGSQPSHTILQECNQTQACTTSYGPAPVTATTSTANVPMHQQQMIQQHGHGGSSFPLRPPIYAVVSTSTAASFPQQPQRRSGKWTVEEEEYANILIEVFNRGAVFEDLQNGITLRSFLSRKLFCEPMRISKKFAGKGIGKKVYIKNPNISTNAVFALQHPTTTTPTNRSNSIMMMISRLREAEMKFLRVAFPGMHGLMACRLKKKLTNVLTQRFGTSTFF